jgi:hypothetical protein
VIGNQRRKGPDWRPLIDLLIAAGADIAAAGGADAIEAALRSSADRA